MFKITSIDIENDGYIINEIVEEGLSGGELRQAILDRAKQNILQGYTEKIKEFIKTYTGRNVYWLKNDKIVEEFDNLLYDMENDEFDDLIFEFVIDPILVGREED